MLGRFKNIRIVLKIGILFTRFNRNNNFMDENYSDLEKG
jgi:hypothetical protein